MENTLAGKYDPSNSQLRLRTGSQVLGRRSIAESYSQSLIAEPALVGGSMPRDIRLLVRGRRDILGYKRRT